MAELAGIQIREINGMGLMRIFRNIREVQTEGLAQTPEFHLTLVFQTELEGLLGDLLQRRLITQSPEFDIDYDEPGKWTPASHYFSTSPGQCGNSPTGI